MNTAEKIRYRTQQIEAFLCIGLDPNPVILNKLGYFHCLAELNKKIIDATAAFTTAYKPQFAHYASLGKEDDLKKTIHYIKDKYPNIAVILDAKRGDIGSTAEKYAHESYDRYNADATTLNPYLGMDALEPFYAYKDKSNIILIKTSNQGGADFQDLILENGSTLYEYIAQKTVQTFGEEQTIFVLGATYDRIFKNMRAQYKNITFLVPGIGAQGGDLKKIIQNGISAQGDGLLLNVSRGITDMNINLESIDSYIDSVSHNAETYYQKIKMIRASYL